MSEYDYQKKYIKYKSKYINSLNFAQMGGNNDVDLITSLMFNKTPFNKYGETGSGRIHSVGGDWAKFFTKDGAERFNITPTNLLKNIINEHNSRGQTILYCAYRFSNSIVISAILSIPSINVNLRNLDGSTPIIGAVFERNSLREINNLIETYVRKGGDITSGRDIIRHVLDEHKNVVKIIDKETPYYIIHLRLTGTSDYPSLSQNTV